MRTSPLEKRFLDKFIPEPNSGCWLWTACCERSGYGNIGKGPKILKAHRVSYELFNGPIPTGSHVLHKCDVKQCVNPMHLFLGTHADNMADMCGKNRNAKGETNGHAKLTAALVKEIRTAPGTLAAIGKKYGVTEATVCDLRKRRRWKHVD